MEIEWYLEKDNSNKNVTYEHKFGLCNQFVSNLLGKDKAGNFTLWKSKQSLLLITWK